MTLVLALPGLMLAHTCRPVVIDREDLAARVFFSESLHAGHFPWLDARAGRDQPFATNPHHAVFYPPTWIYAIFDPRHADPITTWLHASLALGGMYRLLRGHRLARRAAFFGAIAFAFSGFFSAHRLDLPLACAAAWTPWVFWRLHRYAQRGGVRRLASFAPVTALLGLAGSLPIAAVTALGSLAYLLSANQRRRQAAARWLVAWICALGLLTAQWLPALARTDWDARASQHEAAVSDASWSPISMVGWILPTLVGQTVPESVSSKGAESSALAWQFTYAGILPLLLAALGLRAGRRSDAYGRAWATVLFLGLLVALGVHGPLRPLLRWTEATNLLGAPAHAALLFNLGVAALAAGVLNDLGASLSPERAQLRARAIAWTSNPFGKAALLIAIPLAAALLTLPWHDAEARRIFRAAFRAGALTLYLPALIVPISVATLWLASRRWKQPAWLTLTVAMVALDLAVVGWQLDLRRESTAPATALASLGEHGPARTREDTGRWARFADATQPGAVRLIEQAPESFVTRIDTWPSLPAPDDRRDHPHLVHVIVSRRALPGWSARAGGQRLRVGATADQRLIAAAPQGLPLTVEWKYTPPGMAAGATISALLAAVLLVAALRDQAEV